MKLILLILAALVIPSASAWEIIRQPEVSNITQEALDSFLDNDTTDERLYTDTFQCGHFSRALATNASEFNITLGGAILSPDDDFQDYDNHIVNYVFVNGSLVFIEPRTDQLGDIDDVNTNGYYRLYPNGQYVPSRW